MPMEIHFHPRRYSYYRPMTRVRRDSLVVSPYDFPGPTAWYGYHEAAGTLRSFRQGVVRNYTEARVESFLKWVKGRWKVDPGRISTVGAIPPGCSGEDSGGSGALWFGLRHPDLVNAVMACSPVIDPSTMEVETKGWRPHTSAIYTERLRLFGRREWKIECAEGGPAWAALDCTPLVKKWKPTARGPYVAIGGYSGQIGAFVNAARDLRRPVWVHSSWGSKPLALIDGAVHCHSNVRCGMRLDRSLPAVTNCSTDRAKNPTFDFGTRVRWDGDGIADEAGKYEVVMWVVPFPQPTRKMTADVTLRRLRKFGVTPGAAFDWKVADAASRKVLQSGTATAGADGLLTIPKCTITSNPVRLTVTPSAKKEG